ncbi:F-type H+-transporting ATPase subunit delta [Ectothiorhodospira magna]|uniref:ATP synthase subunit delta n=1 Tax=Ectothiorhodospira magna TaxID=867345 RepID=A0A1H9C5V9_9GAMM|nr:F0F1 ATP synthase subunit delta [Ectothiorhodospira magna]SEP96223.1 F-type H+-transporting ATPase subunit delta [Ectothiorhodospira magna]
MSENTTAARPYAKAVFEVARDAGKLAGWSDQLAFMSAVAHDPNMRALLDSPKLTRETIAKAFLDVCKGKVDDSGQNFIRLLAENGRLALLPEITALFEVMRAAAENKVEATVISAQAVDAEQQKSIAAALKKRLGKEVELVCEVDDSLIGGAIIRAGDLVIDGSVRGRLTRLASNLSR